MQTFFVERILENLGFTKGLIFCILKLAHILTGKEVYLYESILEIVKDNEIDYTTGNVAIAKFLKRKTGKKFYTRVEGIGFKQTKDDYTILISKYKIGDRFEVAYQLVNYRNEVEYTPDHLKHFDHLFRPWNKIVITPENCEGYKDAESIITRRATDENAN